MELIPGTAKLMKRIADLKGRMATTSNTSYNDHDHVSDRTSQKAAEDLNTEIKNLLERKLVDCLNEGSKAALMTLAGIGEKRAGLILNYRKSNPFQEV